MENIFIDLECYSDIDLSRCGTYKYCQTPNHQILLFGYSLDSNDVSVVELAKGEKIPEEIIRFLLDNNVTKWAFNANYERINLSYFLQRLGYLKTGEFLNPKSWKCHMVWSAYLGLPLSLKGVGKVLNLDSYKCQYKYGSFR